MAVNIKYFNEEKTQELLKEKGHLGIRVRVYPNRQNGCFSVQTYASPRRVLYHAKHVQLANPQFRVSAQMQKRAAVTYEKNTHAWVEGDLIHLSWPHWKDTPPLQMMKDMNMEFVYFNFNDPAKEVDYYYNEKREKVEHGHLAWCWFEGYSPWLVDSYVYGILR